MCQFPVTMSRLEEVYHNMNWMTSTHFFASSQLASSYCTAPNISWPYCSLKFLDSLKSTIFNYLRQLSNLYMLGDVRPIARCYI